MIEDTYAQKGQREKMCKQLQEKGITNGAVLAAMNKVPRHWYMDSALWFHAYDDQALPILCDQTISQPSTVATQSSLLQVEQGMKVLEVGTGSGYQTAILCELGAKVFTIERQKGLYEKTKALLQQVGYRAKCFLGDGYKGAPSYAPFDRIIITCGAPEVPQALMDQLKPGGLMVIPVGDNEMEMLRIAKPVAEGEGPKVERFGNCKFVPMLGKVKFR